MFEGENKENERVEKNAHSKSDSVKDRVAFLESVVAPAVVPRKKKGRSSMPIDADKTLFVPADSKINILGDDQLAVKAFNYQQRSEAQSSTRAPVVTPREKKGRSSMPIDADKTLFVPADYARTLSQPIGKDASRALASASREAAILRIGHNKNAQALLVQISALQELDKFLDDYAKKHQADTTHEKVIHKMQHLIGGVNKAEKLENVRSLKNAIRQVRDGKLFDKNDFISLLKRDYELNSKTKYGVKQGEVSTAILALLDKVEPLNKEGHKFSETAQNPWRDVKNNKKHNT